MGCNCKADKNIDGLMSNGNSSTEKPSQKITNYVLKTIALLLIIVLLPIINLVIIWFVFRTLILNRDVDIKPLLLSIGNKFKPKDEEEEDDYEDLTEDDVIMVDVEDITNKSK